MELMSVIVDQQDALLVIFTKSLDKPIAESADDFLK